MRISGYMAGAAAITLLVLGPSAMAQQGSTSGQSSSTSGPAAGSPVQPSTAVQKQTPGAAPQGTTGAQAQQGGVGAGAPGVAAKPGTEGGPAPRSNEGMVQGTEVAQADDWGWRDRDGWGPGGWGHWREDGGWGRGGWGWGHGGWRGGKGWQEGGWRRMHRGHHAAHFMFRSPRGAFAVKCGEDEPMRACVEAVTAILDKLQSMHQGTPSQPQPGTSGPTPPATPGPTR